MSKTVNPVKLIKDNQNSTHVNSTGPRGSYGLGLFATLYHLLQGVPSSENKWEVSNNAHCFLAFICPSPKKNQWATFNNVTFWWTLFYSHFLLWQAIVKTKKHQVTAKKEKKEDLLNHIHRFEITFFWFPPNMCIGSHHHLKTVTFLNGHEIC